MKTPLELDLARTAFVAIDLQMGIIARPTKPYSSFEVVTNAVKIARVCREKDMPVFLVHVTPSPDGKDRLTPYVDETPNWGANMQNWSEFVPEIERAETDFVITKRQWGAFTGTELDLQLRRRGITTIILCGVATNIGVESTARFAYELGYDQVFVEDAMSSRSDEEHKHTVQTIFPRIGRVRSTEEVLAALH